MENEKWYSQDELEALFEDYENVAPVKPETVIEYAQKQGCKIYTDVDDIIDKIHRPTLEKQELNRMIADKKELKDIMPTGRNKSNQKSLRIEELIRKIKEHEKNMFKTDKFF